MTGTLGSLWARARWRWASIATSPSVRRPGSSWSRKALPATRSSVVHNGVDLAALAGVTGGCRRRDPASHQRTAHRQQTRRPADPRRRPAARSPARVRLTVQGEGPEQRALEGWSPGWASRHMSPSRARLPASRTRWPCASATRCFCLPSTQRGLRDGGDRGDGPGAAGGVHRHPGAARGGRRRAALFFRLDDEADLAKKLERY